MNYGFIDDETIVKQAKKTIIPKSKFPALPNK